MIGVCLVNTALLTSCSSTALSTANGVSGSGFAAYSLPKALLPVSLSDNCGDVTITITNPIYTRDLEHTYRLTHRSSPFADDDFTIEVDPSTGLLSKVHLTRTDQTDEIIVEAAKSVAALLESATAQGAVQITSIIVDPSDPVSQQEGERRLNAALHDYASLQLGKKGCGDQAEYRRILQSSMEFTKISVTSYGNPARPSGPAAPVDCSIGVCSRATIPYQIVAGFGSLTSQTLVDLPNNAPVYAIPLSGTTAVEKVTNVDFDHGLVKSAHVKKSSEALDLVKVPYRVVVAFFTALSEIIQLKIDTSGKQAELIKSEAALEKAKMEARQQQQAKNESAILDAGGTQDVLLRVSTAGSQQLGPLGHGLQDTRPAPTAAPAPVKPLDNGGLGDGSIANPPAGGASNG